MGAGVGNARIRNPFKSHFPGPLKGGEKTGTLVGTDLHFSGGGIEIGEWCVADSGIEGAIDTQWNYPTTVTVAFPQNEKYDIQKITVTPEDREFSFGRKT